MVETITPVVYGGNRRRWLVGVAMMVLGGTVVAGAFGALLGAAGAAFGAPWGAIGFASVTVVALAYLARETLEINIPVLAARRQVPEWWRTFFSPHIAAVLYGAGLGIGFFTYLTYGTLVVVAAAALAVGRPMVGILVMAPFGFARTATVLVAHGAHSSDALGSLVTRLAQFGGTSVVKGANIAALVALAATAAVAAAAEGAVPRSQPAAAIGSFAVAIVGMIFAWTAVTKALAFARWKGVLVGYGLPTRVQAVIAWAVPLCEGLVAILVIIGRTWVASAVAVLLLLTFSIAILRARSLQGSQIACGCFGSRRRRDYRVLLLRNILLAALAVFGLVWAPSPNPTIDEVALVPLLLSLTGVALIASVLHLTTKALRGGRT